MLIATSSSQYKKLTHYIFYLLLMTHVKLTMFYRAKLVLESLELPRFVWNVGVLLHSKPDIGIFFSDRDIHTYHLRFIPEGVVEVSQIFLRDSHVLPKLVSYEKHCTVVSPSPSYCSLSQVAFYDIHGGKRKVLFFYFVSETTRDRDIL
jgi:hypothetical protein